MEGESAVMAVHGPRSRRRRARRARAAARGARPRWKRCAPTTSISSTPGTRPRGASSTRSSPPRRPGTCSHLPSGSPPIMPDRTSVRSCFRRSTRPPPLGTGCPAFAAAALSWCCARLRPEATGPSPARQAQHRSRPHLRRSRRRRHRRQGAGRGGPLRPMVPAEAAYGHGWMPLGQYRSGAVSPGTSQL